MDSGIPRIMFRLKLPWRCTCSALISPSSCLRACDDEDDEDGAPGGKPGSAVALAPW